MRPLEGSWLLALRPCPARNELSFGRVDPICLCWGASLDEQFGESAVATANVYPAQARGGRQPIEKLFTCELAPDTHCALIDITIVEMDRLVNH